MALSKITTNSITDDAVTTAKVNADAIGTTELANDVAISTSGATALTNKLTVLAADGTVDNDWVMDVRNDEATDDRSYGLRVSAGSSTTDRALDVLDHAQANTLLRVNGSGHVTKPKTPYFFGGRNSGQTGSGNDFVSTVAITNRGSHYDTSNGRFTAPVAGDYLCSFKTFSSPQGLSNAHYQVSLRVNGTSVSIYYFYHSGTHFPIAFSEILNLSASDYVTAHVHGSLTVYGTDHTYATQSFYLLG